MISERLGRTTRPVHKTNVSTSHTVYHQPFSAHKRCLISRGTAACSASHAVAEAGLTPQQVQKFHEDGFLVLEGFASKQEVEKLRNRIAELIQEFDPHTISIFSTRNQTTKSDQYFLDSASDIGFFFEEKAFDDQGNLRQDKALSINKVGHALHDLDPVFREFSRSDKVKAVLKGLGYKRPLPVQSMYIFKQPSIGGEVVPHQDSTFIHTQPLSCVGLWWALEDATKDNGCLWAQPGVHKQGLTRRFFVKDGKVQFDHAAPEYEYSKFVPLECPAGTLVLLQGENIHYSDENRSPISRHSYSMHFVESTDGVTWTADNWAQRKPNMPWEPLYE